MAFDPVLLVGFVWQNEEMYCCHMAHPPRVGEYVTLPQLTHELLGKVETPTTWRVHAVAWTLGWEQGIGELRPEVDVHLRRLYPHEWANRHEPTGMAYADPDGV